MKKYIFLFLVLTSWSLKAQDKKEVSKEVAKESFSVPDPPLSQTKHQLNLNGQVINYTATTGYLLLREENGKPKGKFFFVAYTKDGVTDPATRPVTFAFNGGPGSASVWLHMGALGPKRIEMTDFGAATKPPYKVVDNEYSWLDLTDLVFIDPVMTGYSRPAEGFEKKEFNGFVEDIETVGGFIYLYTSRYERWNSPKFLAGESYGTTRAAGLSGHLQDRYGMYLNGIVLISSILNFETAEFDRGNELPFVLFLPTYSAMAWYHKKLAPEFADLKSLLKEVEIFALGEYNNALMKGDKLSPDERKGIVDKLSRYTGLSKDYLEKTNLRIQDSRFTKELLRSEGKTVGRLDGRFTGFDYDDAGQSAEFDPSYNAGIYGPFTMAVHDHIRRTLNYENDIPYEILTGRAHPWSFANVQNQYLNVAETLRNAMTKNKDLKVLICNGYYDMATPYFATDYTINHMFLDSSLRGNITSKFYEAGHMVYIHKPSLIQLKKDITEFYQNTLKK
jgi:carboxypeptidase C (cathepsin A)